MFAFGYGLTYTTFDYRRPSFRGGDGLTAEVTLTNTGKRAGVEVAQLYAAPPGRTHRLVGWARVELQPGESRRVTISADPRLLASWDQGAAGWRRAGGRFDAYVGRSAEQVEGRGQVRISADADVPRTVAGAN